MVISRPSNVDGSHAASPAFTEFRAGLVDPAVEMAEQKVSNHRLLVLSSVSTGSRRQRVGSRRRVALGPAREGGDRGSRAAEFTVKAYGRGEEPEVAAAKNPPA